MTEEHDEYEIEYTEQFLEDILKHKKVGQKSILLKINSLIGKSVNDKTI